MKKQLRRSITAALFITALTSVYSYANAGGESVEPSSQTSGVAPSQTSGIAPSSTGETRPSQTSGVASWYGPDFDGKKTASGEQFNPQELTAAHPSLPFGTEVEVTNLDNGRSVTVRINDRGAFGDTRVIDLSKAAAKNIGIVDSGVAPVRLDVLGS
ncbi:MAG: septal ring lytic transglycosylase RlpA family lipoprotein [Cyanobacteria bacterium QH_9_48_43]|nr:MAG: septal ring lytic transglycosylase RlpA family lipoprotein [Cyanobacteria bacterium QH_7_48_89]PSO63921.1 MAG: septal ring lytic transglycosylase RlpA family lipoprotein [Cyanobacteria bacterium QH_2_48_84]PSO74711.1 MAG: septal ring lytic transglycosylase RlpA family lipoprotein [Cyanobacteria bacterium QS_1_48_34]PSO77644.1 MAG: septal ring lytic transglycosylase RlpA family lipoprotein [Cyanobacteria bacterium QS_4_48_99]PSO81510.1 MAG: septal ring lytic transglycosylase RlpA family 